MIDWTYNLEPDSEEEWEDTRPVYDPENDLPDSDFYADEYTEAEWENDHII